jgi:Ca2+-binding EF-hand superfamily protein
MDEMDMILMQPSKDHETDLSPRIKNSFSFSPRPSPEKSLPSLKFHLHTKESDGGYLLSLSQRRICHLRSILETSSLHKMEAEVVCNRVLAKATKSKTPRLTKENFESAISSLLSCHAERALSDILLGVFAAFDRESTGKVSAIEVACGFTVLCSGKKSDKLEFAFEVLDKRKKGHLNKADMTNYLKAFLTVLLSIAFAPGLDDDSSEATLTTLKGRPCDPSFRTMMNVVESGAHWAATMAFEGCPQNGGSGREPSMSFDDFADWYTK